MKKIILYICILSFMLGISGCGKTLEDFIKTDLTVQITARIDENQSVLDTLHNSGIITDKLYESLSESLNSSREAYSNLDKTSMNQFLSCIYAVKRVAPSEFTFVYDNDGNRITDYNNKYVDDNIISHNIIKNKYISSLNKDLGNGWIASSSEDDTNKNALKLLDNSSSLDGELSKIGKYTIYALDGNKLKDTGVDTVIAAIKSSVDENGKASEESAAILNRYFYNTNEQLFSHEQFKEGYIIDITKQNFSSSKNRTGLDLVITQNGMDILAIRIKELNIDYINNIIERSGLNSGKYILDSKNNRAYLMEYPVSTLETFSSDGNNVIATLSSADKSEIGINLYTKQLLKYSTKNGEKQIKGTVIGSGIANYNNYLNLDGADNSNSEQLSSFVFGENHDIYIEKDIDNRGNVLSNQTRKITTANLILRDYLELVYAPDYSDNYSESMYVFGRKLRLNIKNKLSDRVELPYNNSIKAVDINGEDLVDSDGKGISIGYDKIIDISASDSIIHMDKSSGENYRVYRIAKNAEQINKEIYSGSISEDSGMKISNLPVTTVAEVKPIIRFPSEQLNSSDYMSEKPEQPIFYAIALGTDLFESGLYSTWIESESSTYGLTWWNNWLANAGYTYSLGRQSVEQYLADNYSYELSQNGVIILDLNTVAQIQEDIDTINNERSNSFRRAVFKAIGWGLIVYSVILMVFWTVDTQVGIGSNLYGIMTFNKCQAIKYKEDIPGGESNINYVNSTKLVSSSIIIIAVGSILMRTDIVSIVYTIVSKLGILSEYISNII